MSKRKTRKFTRPQATREYKKVITIFPEGEKTEVSYFAILRSMVKTVNISIKKGNKKTEPKQVLDRAKKYIRDGLSKNEQVWLVIDVDCRPKGAFEECLQWEETNDKYNLAISNPKFEYWLLMHFESGNDIKNADDCMKKLMKHIPNYSKRNISDREITRENCKVAIDNGKRKHENGADVLQDNCVTVYKLVKEIFEIQ